MALKVESKVSWSSQAQGYWVEKKGTVLAVVPAGKRVYDVLDGLTPGPVRDTYNVQAIDPRTSARKVESYIIEVAAKGKPKLYWPMPSALGR